MWALEGGLMKLLAVIGGLLAVFAPDGAYAQSSSAIRVYERPAVILGTVTLPKRLMADAPGTYQVRLTNDEPKSAVGQSPGLERYVEFLRGGKVVGREVATVIFEGDISTVAKGRRPGNNSSMVQMLKGGDYWRVWINKDGKNYIINLPPGA
jgi:hypothetical protein